MARPAAMRPRLARGLAPVGDVGADLRQAVAVRLPGGQHQVDGVVDHAPVDVDAVRHLLQPQQGVQGQHLARLGWVDAHPVDDLHLLGPARVAEHDLHEEPVALGLREGVDALGFDRVLGGQHQEGLGHLEGLATDGDLVLGHDLQQRRLHLGGGPVDLVGQQEVDEHRPELHVEALRAGPVDASAHHVGRQQVGRELQPGEAAADHGGDGLRRQGLGQAGTPSSRQWPRASRQTMSRSMARSWPTMTRLTSNSAGSSRRASSAGSEALGIGVLQEARSGWRGTFGAADPGGWRVTTG